MRKLYGLQYLRGLAAVSVAAFHASGHGGRDFHAGEAGVDLFFLLSGFLMVAITNVETGALSFLGDRARRVVPIYWLGTAVMLIGGLLGLFPNLILETAHVVASFLFIPCRSPNGGHAWPLLIPGWTLNYEMFFYCIFAAFLQIRKEKTRLIALTIFFSALVGIRLIIAVHGAVGYTYTDPILLEFAAGCWLGYFWKTAVSWPRALGWVSGAISLGAIGLASIIAPSAQRAVAFGIPAALLLASVLSLEERKPIGRRPLLVLLGDASYSIYIWHGLGISLAAMVATKMRLAAPATICFVLLVGLVAGIAAYALIERPILTYFAGRKRLRRAHDFRNAPIVGGS